MQIVEPPCADEPAEKPNESANGDENFQDYPLALRFNGRLNPLGHCSPSGPSYDSGSTGRYSSDLSAERLGLNRFSIVISRMAPAASSADCGM
jgi:hypothetical protein